ncbi:hypothetical protein RDV64_15680 [Acuticoccus sp. MNP-M23]|uniref:hypothetical protein n=1 Tax=Acuticoccus sp. MNP-M23 TaxID=3072793 RepID=UPI002815F6EB|nr:hypothetical protein [Acuticoccus sp. MNP-M23]WMS41512.1 hypothetical protein RDV64_15680 [Acuticoccus sp. MNP-M23]
MRKQIFETIPTDDQLPGLYQVLRYENASQRAEISSLESEVERLKAQVDAMEEKLGTQQLVIDDFGAELRTLRRDAR